MELWNCDNGCDFKGGAGEFYQMSSPDGSHLMLVCGDCVYDRHLSEWTVDLDSDPRDVTYTLEDIDGSSISILNGIVTRSA